MFHRPGRKTNVLNAKPLKDLTAILSPAHMLTEGKRPELLKGIAELSALEPARFETLGLSLINNMIKHCQNLPETSNSYYASPGGLLDHALNRTEAALSLFRHYLVQENGANLSEEQKLWVYALFSAAILQGIGKLETEYRVDLYDGNGRLLKPWSPLLESMAAVGGYYQFEFQPEGEDDFRRRLNLLLARLLMPASGFAWIVSNREVLVIWLALLNEDLSSAGTLGAILIRADAISIQRYFNTLMIRHMGTRGGRSDQTGPRTSRLSTFVDKAPESIAEKELFLGIAFTQWLVRMLETGGLTIDQTFLHLVPGGILLSTELFKMFVQKHPGSKSWQAAQKAFLSLGLHSLNADGDVISRFEQKTTHKIQSGIVFAKYGVALPEHMNIQNLHTGKTSSISAVELVHLAQFASHFNRQEQNATPTALASLTASGEWQPTQTSPDHAIQPGKPHRG